ncbi:MAG: MAPEG family protein [Woeseiaceae bacterium]|nr:MAPEG family protein [Woeseiaceae bacterium]
MREQIVWPMLAMVGLTLAVWLFMYAKRLHWIFSNRVPANDLKTPRQRDALIPEEVSYASFNFQNLFELPVVFYALCLLLYVTGNVAMTDLVLAWTFVVGRVIHSAVHTTFNDVRLRFASYLLSAVALWVLFGRAVVYQVG